MEKISDGELKGISETLEASIKSLENKSLSPLLGHALTGLRASKQSVDGELANRVAEASKPAK